MVDCSEPSNSLTATTSLKGKEGVHGTYALVGSSSSTSIEPPQTTIIAEIAHPTSLNLLKPQ